MKKRILVALLTLFAGALGNSLAQVKMGMVQTSAMTEDYWYFSAPAFSSLTGLGYVADAQNRQVIVFNPYRMSGNIVATVATGNRPAGIYISPNGAYGCVLNAGSPGTVTIIHLSDLTYRTFSPGTGSFTEAGNIAFTADSQYGLVCNSYQGANKVYVFNLSTGAMTQQLNVGNGPVRTYINPAGTRAFVVCTGNTPPNSDQLSVLNVASPPSFSVVTTVAVTDADFDLTGSYGICHNNIAFSPDGVTGYICDPNYNDILSFNTANPSSQTYVHPLGEASNTRSMSRVAVSPDGNFLLATSIVNSYVHVLSISGTTMNWLRAVYDTSGQAGWDGYNNLILFPGSYTAAIASVDSGELVYFDYNLGNIISYTPTGASNAGPEQIALAPDGSMLAVVNVAGGPSYTLKDSVGLICMFPMVINAPILVSGSPEFTGYAVSNPMNSAISLVSYAIDKNGADLTGTANPASQVLDAQNQLAFLGGTYFGLTNPTTPAWVQIFSNSSTTRGFFLETDTTGSYLDGTVASPETFRDFYVTRISESFGGGVYQKKTQIVVINPTGINITFDLILKDTLGNTVATLSNQALTSGAVFEGSIRDIFFRTAPSVDINSGYVVGKVKSTYGSVTGMALTRYYDGAQNCITLRTLPFTVNPSVSKLYCPHVVTGGESPGLILPYDTTFSIVNTATEVNQVTFTFHRDGVAEPLTAQTEIPAGGQFVGAAWNLFALPDPAGRPPYVTGYMEVSATKTGILGDAVFGDGLNAQPQFQSALLMEPQTYNDCIFSHVAVGLVPNTSLIYFNGFSLVNPSSTKAINVTMRVYRQNGSLTGTKTLNVPASGRILSLISNEIPATDGQMGGYVAMESADPFVALELFQDGAFKLLSAIPRN